MRRLILPAVALLLVGLTYSVARVPFADASERSEIAEDYKFTELPIALPPGLDETRSVREVNPAYDHIKSWISSVGAGIALNDLDGNGRPDDLCVVDTRSDSVIVTPAPGTGSRYAPFLLDVAPLPSHDAMAPMGCTPGDFNADGRMDVLAYYWGRTPVLFMPKASATGTLASETYQRVEVIPTMSDEKGSYEKGYAGPRWNTNAIAIDDFDGDGHPDIFVPNYFPDSDVLDPDGLDNVEMHRSMSKAENAGGAHMLRWVGSTSGDAPSARFVEDRNAIPFSDSVGWTLGAGSVDLTGDLKPELYIANDFGPDHLLYNTSEPGEISFRSTSGKRGPLTPKSLVLGHDSFKSMGIDFGDLHQSGKFDMFVSNITFSWGIEESNFVWRNTSSDLADAREQMASGTAPFADQSAKLKMAWTGWGWDAKMADFANSGNLSVVQTDGFVKGEVNRWNWLQELAMTNDELVPDPKMWPNARPGDDLSGSDRVHFWAKADNGTYVDIAQELGVGPPVPTRGVAVADVDGDGFQDFAVARQWGPPAFYRNDHPSTGQSLSLKLTRPAPAGHGVPAAAQTPAYGAQVRITTADGKTQVSRLDGGSGHSGKRSFEVLFGLGNTSGAVAAEIRWRDTDGRTHAQKLDLEAGMHHISLGTSSAEVVTGR